MNKDNDTEQFDGGGSRPVTFTGYLTALTSAIKGDQAFFLHAGSRAYSLQPAAAYWDISQLARLPRGPAHRLLLLGRLQCGPSGDVLLVERVRVLGSGDGGN